MADSNKNPETPDWLKAMEGTIEPFVPDLSDEQWAVIALPNFAYEAQLIAIKEILSHNRQAEKAEIEKIREFEETARTTSGLRGQAADVVLIEHYNLSVYHDAARSMAAVGMLAPFYEAVFHQAFLNIGKHFASVAPSVSQHDRWKQAALEQWDCHYVWNNGKRSGALVQGIIQIATAAGVSSYLPSNLKHTLEALFEYRNRMFHSGFEWVTEERENFAKRTKTSGWPKNWFSFATKNNKPWVIYMADSFIEHCIESIEKSIEGIGAFCKATFVESRKAPGT